MQEFVGFAHLDLIRPGYGADGRGRPKFNDALIPEILPPRPICHTTVNVSGLIGCALIYLRPFGLIYPQLPARNRSLHLIAFIVNTILIQHD